MQMKVENQIGLLLAFERPFKSNNQTSFLITFLTWKIYKKKKRKKNCSVVAGDVNAIKRIFLSPPPLLKAKNFPVSTLFRTTRVYFTNATNSVLVRHLKYTPGGELKNLGEKKKWKKIKHSMNGKSEEKNFFYNFTDAKTNIEEKNVFTGKKNEKKKLEWI